MVGRCAIGTKLYHDDAGDVAVGGLRSMGLKQIAGVLVGRPERAARDLATPVVSGAALSRWATAQATLMGTADLTESERRAVAWAVFLCGGGPG
jgi:hypothetical protein